MNMAVMDIEDLEPLAANLKRLLKPAGCFVATILHPLFFTSGADRQMLVHENPTTGTREITHSIILSKYSEVPPARQIIFSNAEPASPPFSFHRPLGELFAPFFRAGLVLDALEEPNFDESFRDNSRPQIVRLGIPTELEAEVSLHEHSGGGYKVMVETERRRRRPAVSCSLCRRRKIKCNRESPCSNCLRSKNITCVYERLSPPPRPRPGHVQASDPAHTRVSGHHSPVSFGQSTSISTGATAPNIPSTSVIAGSTRPSTPGSLSSTREVESLRSRIKQLEERLAKTQNSIPSGTESSDFSISTTESQFAGTFHIHHQRPSTGHGAVIARTIMHKTRFFGQSHWINGGAPFFDILETIEPYIQNESSNVLHDMLKCKYLARVIKSHRRPPWPTPLTTELPAKEVADTLVDIYLRTIESIYRILHIPSFRQEYEALWIAQMSPNLAFLVQLKLIFAIGAVMYDDLFSLRTSAIRWIYEAQTWFSEPEFKSRLNIQFLQTNILLLMARELVGIEGSLTWISAGELIRTGMHMGLHRDPLYLPKTTTLVMEMRRRLWNTILEITLQTSMESAGPPLLSLDDFDTQPPGNFDDDQIMTEGPAPKPEHGFTQMSIPLALRKLFPLRLAIAKSLNGISSHSVYEDTLRLDSELRASYKAICKTLQGYSCGNVPSQFQVRILDYFVRRYLLALHMPFLAPAMHDTTYAFSRRVVVDTSLKLWCIVYPSSSLMTSSVPKPTQNQISSSDPDELVRLAFCGSGLFRHVSVQVCLLISAELRAQIQEEDGLGPFPLRRDLLSVLDDAKKWQWRCIEAGETNMKGYFFMSLISAQIGGLMRSLPKDQFPELLIKAAEEAEAQCVPFLEAKASRDQDDIGLDFDGIDDITPDTLPDLLGDWSFLMPDPQFDFTATEPVNWVYGGLA